MTSQPIHSTGRGGAGNIGPSDLIYTDGGIVREGNNPSSSSGRGGAGNIPHAMDGTPIIPTSADVIPESATRIAGQAGYENYHTGRAGAGNVHKESKVGGEDGEKKEGLVEKVKHVIGLDGHGHGHHGHKREKTPEVN